MSINDFLSNAARRKKKESQVSEIDIESPFVKYAKIRGCRAYKLIFLRKKGFPDRTILCPGGRVFFIEFKRKNKKSSPAQVAVRKTLITLGFEYYVCDNKGQAEAILDEFLEWQ